MKLTILIAVFIGLLVKIALIGGIIWAATHFIVKYW